MSRISAASSIRAIARAAWKRFAASVTDFAREYRYDFFIRTEANIILLQVLFALIIGGLAVGSLIVLYRDLINSIASALATALTSTTKTLSPAALVTILEAARAREIVRLSALIIFATAIFGYLVSRFALVPTRKALEAQKQFVGNIAHELRTPLAIIKTNIEVRLLESDVPQHARETHLSNLEELDRISDIINNLLSLNSLVQPERIPFTDVDLVQTVQRVIGKLDTLIRKKPVRVVVDAEQAQTVHGNATALEQIAMNLIKNAVSYTSEGDIMVRISSADPDTVEFTVTDTGSGINHEDLMHIFEPFYRGDRARTRTSAIGSGLGLTIVSELVKMHRGSIRIKSVPGKGTSVSVVLSANERIASANTAVPTEEDGMHVVQADFSSLMRTYHSQAVHDAFRWAHVHSH